MECNDITVLYILKVPTSRDLFILRGNSNVSAGIMDQLCNETLTRPVRGNGLLFHNLVNNSI